MDGPRSPHLHWIDALKVLVVGGIAVFHGTLVFSGRPWLVNNPQPDVVMAAFAAFTFQWGLALLFALSGMATWFALRRRTPAGLLKIRWRSFGIPLVLGILTISPLQAIVASHQPLTAGSYIDWFRAIRITAHLSSIAGTVYHLWFLVFLLLITTATAPVLSWLRTARGRRLIDWLAERASGRWGFLLLGAPIFAVAAIVQPLFPAFGDWGDLAKEAAVFVLGAVIVSDARLVAALRHQARSSLVVGVAAALGLGLAAVADPSALGSPGYRPMTVAVSVVCAANTWAWVTFFLAFGTRVLDTPAAWPGRLGELSLPFYVLHHPVLVVAATIVVGFPLGPWPKLALILVPTYLVTGGLCLLVERSAELRSLFGLHGATRLRFQS